MKDAREKMYDIITHNGNNERLVEMAIINPQLCQSISIQVEVEQSDEGEIPHMHVYKKSIRDDEHCVFIRLDKAEYSEHHNGKYHNVLSKKEKKEFIRVMKSIWGLHFIESPISGEIKKATGYEAAVNTWIDTYGKKEKDKFNYDKNGIPIMPDYTKLKKTIKPSK